ncbi:MAG: GGDEF domain-containing protein [Lachnospiraceae bacterium]|nr:GGDEF domain-containing protein [Lachnospiraceae bacterium]
MKKSLKKRILMLMFIFVITLNVLSIVMNYQNFVNTNQQAGLSTANTVAETCALIINGDSLEKYIQTGLRDSDYYVTWNKLLDYKNTNSDIVKLSVIWFDSDYGNYIFDTDLTSTGAFLGDRIPLDAEQKKLSSKLTDGNNLLSITYSDRIEIYRPVLSSYNIPMGYVIVGINTLEAEREQFQYLYQLVLVSFALTLIATVFFVLIINKTIVSPINALSAAVGSYVDSMNANATDSPLAHLSIQTGDEIETLFHSIRKMESDILNSTNNLAIAMWNSQHDSMTQLYNKRYLTECKSAFEVKKSIGIIYFDVDNLKKMNDTCGHEAGDEVIKKTAQFIQKYQTEDRIGFRMGGDEFMMIVPDTTDQNIEQLVTVMKTDPDTHLSRPDQEIQCRIAIGFAYCEGEIDLDTLIKAADADMYLDKKSHR